MFTKVIIFIALFFLTSLTVIAQPNCTDLVPRSMMAFQDVITANGKFVAVNGIGDNILISSDGSDWKIIDTNITKVTSTKFISLRSIAWNGEFFLVLNEEDTILKSTDLTNWEQYNISIDDDPFLRISPFSKIVWENNKFFIISGGHGSSPLLGRWYELAYSNKALLSKYLSSHLDEKFAILSSIDGNQWKRSHLTPDVSYIKWTGKEYVALTSVAGVLTSEDAKKWKYFGNNEHRLVLPTAIANNEKIYVIVADKGLIFTSQNGGKSWEGQRSGVKTDLNNILWDGKQFIVVGDCGTILTSADGMSWNSSEINMPVRLIKIVWNGHKYVTVGAELLPFYGMRSYDAVVLVSSDGKKWTNTSSGQLKSEYKKRYTDRPFAFD